MSSHHSSSPSRASFSSSESTGSADSSFQYSSDDDVISQTYKRDDGDCEANSRDRSENENENQADTKNSEYSPGHLQRLMDTIRCQLCEHYLIGSIRQCRSGHYFCENCFSRMYNCVICCKSKTSARCFLMENFAEQISFPCRYHTQGCAFVEKASKLKLHQKYCKYNTIACSLRAENNCTWEGPLIDLKQHSTEKHAGNFFTTNEQSFTFRYFSSRYSGCNRYYNLLEAYDSIFICIFELNHEINLARWFVFLIGHPEEVKNYSFSTKFSDRMNKYRNIFVRSPCSHYEDGSRIFPKHLCIDLDMLKAICDHTGSLHYTVRISCRSQR